MTTTDEYQDDWHQDDGEPIKSAPVGPGDTVHFLESRTLTLSAVGVNGRGVVVNRGEPVCLTREIMDANRNRLGFSVFDIAHDEEAQAAKFGRVIVRVGRYPESKPLWQGDDGSVVDQQGWQDAREAARKAAHALLDEGERNAALRAVQRRFGRDSTSSTLVSYAGGR